MIEIRVNKVKDSDSEFSVDSVVRNAGAEALAEKLRDELSSMSCNSHPDKKSVLIITPDSTSSFKFDKSGFCCKEFADTITI